MKNVIDLSCLERRLIANEYLSSELEGVDKAIKMCDKMCGYAPDDLDISVTEMLKYLDTRSAFIYGLIAMCACMEQ